MSCPTPDPGKYYKITNVRSGLLIGSYNNSLDVNVTIVQDSDLDTDSQLWSFIPKNTANQTYNIINLYSGLALSSTPNFTLYQWTALVVTDTNQTDQIFQLKQSADGCFIKPYPFENFLTINYCSYNKSQFVLTYWYCEIVRAVPDCQQFIVEEVSKKTLLSSCTKMLLRMLGIHNYVS